MRTFPICLVVLGCPLVCYSQDTITPEKALSSYEDYLGSICNVSFHSTFMDRVAEKSDHFTNTLSEKWKVDFAGRRLWRTTQKVIENPKTESEKEFASTYFEALVTPGAQYGISAHVDTRTAYRVTSYMEPPKDYWKTQTGLGYLSYPFGYLKDGREYKYIPDMVREASKSILSGEGDSSSVIVLAAKTEQYEFNIALDPSKGWLAERIEFTRSGPAEDADRPAYCLYTVEHSGNQGGVWVPDRYHCRVARPSGQRKLPGNIRVVDGKIEIVPEGSESGTDFVEKPQSTLIAEVTLSDIKVGSLSDSDFQLQTTIPNGLEVSMQDALHLDFVWRDGRVVALTDESLEALRDSKFLGGPGSPRFWTVILGVSLVVLVVYLIIRDRRKARPT